MVPTQSAVNTALETLISLIQDSSKHLLVFLPKLKQLLDYIQNFNVEQARHLYQLLFCLGGADDSDLGITGKFSASKMRRVQ